MVDYDSDSDSAPEEFSSSAIKVVRGPSPKPDSKKIQKEKKKSKNDEGSDSDSAPEEFSSSAVKVAKPDSKKIKKDGSKVKGSRSVSQSKSPIREVAKDKLDGQHAADSSKKGIPFSKPEDDSIYAFCARHQDIKQADVPCQFRYGVS
jgi:hypothetical protein